MLTFREAAEHFRRMRYEMPFALEREVRLVMEGAAKEAKGFIGDDKLGWPELQPSTIAEKERLGYPTPAPLLREETLRDSLEAETESFGREIVGQVGSTDPVSIYHEVGTSRVPPRPFIAPAMMLAEPLLVAELGELAIRSLTPGGHL